MAFNKSSVDLSSKLSWLDVDSVVSIFYLKIPVISNAIFFLMISPVSLNASISNM
jgi:hypothetical protein